MATAQDLLDQTNEAITKALAAQDYTIAGRNKRMAELRDLKAFRRELMDEIAAGSSGNGSMATLGMQVEPS
jgi:hypothetical protein